MTINSFFKSLIPSWGKPEDKVKAREPETPTLDPPLHVSLSDGWDHVPTDETDIDVVRDKKSTVDYLSSQKKRVEGVANHIAALDDGPKDLNKNPGTVLVEGKDIPRDATYGRPTSALVVFDEDHDISQADIRYERGSATSTETVLFEKGIDDTQTFANVRTGRTPEGMYNVMTHFEITEKWHIHSDGTIEKSRSEK